MFIFLPFLESIINVTFFMFDKFLYYKNAWLRRALKSTLETSNEAKNVPSRSRNFLQEIGGDFGTNST